MFRDRFSFYRSKEWRKLLDNLKHERLNDDGEIICEYCGKPITRAYDAIGHHKIELTEENVNDYDISLNPQNIQLVHHACHNRIHNKLGYANREVFLVYGAPLSGKSTWVKESMSPGDLVIDIDSIWQCVSNLSRYEKPARLKSVVFKVRDSLLDAVKYRLGKWNNAYVIGGYPLQSERERLIKELHAREVYIECSIEECLKRLQEAEDGRDKAEWERYIRAWFDSWMPPGPVE
jgi:predicted kinase